MNFRDNFHTKVEVFDLSLGLTCLIKEGLFFRFLIILDSNKHIAIILASEIDPHLIVAMHYFVGF